MKKRGVLPSIENQAFHTEGQVKAIIAAMESAGVAPSGMILMQEKVTSAVANDLFWIKYQRGVENGLFKSINGDDFFFARTLIYKNPIENGKDFIRLGDGAASFVNGSQKVLSKTTIDSKGFQNAWSQLRSLTGQRMLADLVRVEGLSGKELFEAAGRKLAKIDDAIRFPDKSGGCFSKGMRVHTRDGVKPIDEIKVGDYVLSSPEDGTGKPE